MDGREGRDGALPLPPNGAPVFLLNSDVFREYNDFGFTRPEKMRKTGSGRLDVDDEKKLPAAWWGWASAAAYFFGAGALTTVSSSTSGWRLRTFILVLKGIFSRLPLG